MEPRIATKTREEHADDINNYIAAREWHRQHVADGTATDGDSAKLSECRRLAVAARVTLPAFGEGSFC
jgi:hypothetical protein